MRYILRYNLSFCTAGGRSESEEGVNEIERERRLCQRSDISDAMVLELVKRGCVQIDHRVWMRGEKL